MQMEQRGNIEHLLVFREERGSNINACPNGIRESHEHRGFMALWVMNPTPKGGGLGTQVTKPE